MSTPERHCPSRWGPPGPTVTVVFAALITVVVVVIFISFTRPSPVGSRNRQTAQTSGGATPKVTTTGPLKSLSRPITVVGIGDSVTAGSVCGCESFVGLYATDLAARLGVQTSSVNLGVGGWTSSQLLQRLSRPGSFREKVATADILLVTIGANDLVPLESRQSTGCSTTCYLPSVYTAGHNVQLIVAAARATQPDHTLTVLVTNYWNVFQDGDVGIARNGGPFERWSDSLTRAENAQICSGAQRAGATCVDLYAPFKGNGSKNPTSLLAADGDHPNSAGHRLIASTLLANTPLPVA